MLSGYTWNRIDVHKVSALALAEQEDKLDILISFLAEGQTWRHILPLSHVTWESEGRGGMVGGCEGG